MTLYFYWLGLIISSALIGSVVTDLIVRQSKKNLGPLRSGLVNVAVGALIALALVLWALPDYYPFDVPHYLLFAFPPLLISFFAGVSAPDGGNPFSS